MTLQDAVEELKCGKKIRLPEWGENVWIVSAPRKNESDPFCYRMVTSFSSHIVAMLSIEDALSDEWEVID